MSIGYDKSTTISKICSFLSLLKDEKSVTAISGGTSRGKEQVGFKYVTHKNTNNTPRSDMYAITEITQNTVQLY